MEYSVRKAADAAAEATEADWGSLTWLAGGRIGNTKGLTLGRVVIRAGRRNPAHSHANCEEALYLLAGKLEHFIGEASVVLEPGDTLTVPPDVPHWARSIGDEDADMIVVYDSANRDFRKH
mgnify:CR=1 FL=1